MPVQSGSAYRLNELTKGGGFGRGLGHSATHSANRVILEEWVRKRKR